MLQTQPDQEAKTLTDMGFLPQKDAAAFLGKSEHTLWRLRKTQGLPYYRISGTICYRKSDLMAYVESCRK